MGRVAGWMERMRLLVRRPLRLPHAVAGFVVLLVVVVLAADSLAPRFGPGPSPSHSPGATPTTSGAPTTSSTEPWAGLHLAAYEQLADLTPISADASGVALKSGFALHSRIATPAAVLAAGLRVDPAFAFTVKAGRAPSDVTIVPATALTPGVRYRFTLNDPTGREIGTWSYRTGHPLQLVGRLPDDQTIGVPTDTGIEMTFDQNGATAVDSHFSISPPVAGTFSTVGRTTVFSPTRPLAPSTLYTVSLAAGVAMTGSDQVLETGARWSFETSGPGVVDPYQLGFGLAMFETSPTEPAVIAVNLSFNEGEAPASIPLQVFRLPTFDAARDAAARVFAVPDWAQLASSDLVPTAGLTRIVDTTLVPDLHQNAGYAVIRLASPLPAGWYLLNIPREGRDRQAILQVTNLAAWATTSVTRTVAWVHDIGTGAPVAGAALIDPSGSRVGTTDASGLIDLTTPASLLAHGDAFATAPTLATVVDGAGARLILAFGAPVSAYAYVGNRNLASNAQEPNDRWWLLMSTDRSTYRPIDTIHAWGVVRARDGGAIPASVQVRLRGASSAEDSGPWLVTATDRPSSRGVWTTDVKLTDLPHGDYILDMTVGGVVVGSTYIVVGDIRKPAYSLDVTSDHAAVIKGDAVHASASARFFDGTAAAGLELRITAFDKSSSATTGASGVATFDLTAATTTEQGYDYAAIGAAPANPEEGQISGDVGLTVFPSSAWISTSAKLEGSTASLVGTISHVDLAAVEKHLALDGDVGNPAGAAYRGRTITIAVKEIVPVTRQTGTTYDFIEKRVVPVLETTYHDEAVGTYTTTSAADGTFDLSVAIPHPDNGYSLTVTAKDDQGRRVSDTSYVSKSAAGQSMDAAAGRPYLDQAATCGAAQKSVPVDGAVHLTMYDRDGSPSSAGTYLFLVSARGIRDVVLQDKPTFERTLREADLPNLDVVAVRFGPGGYYATNEVQVIPTPESRTLTVALAGDKARYAPGDTATVSVTTTGLDGLPVAADVVIRGVDQKLFAANTAVDINALSGLLAPVQDGTLQSVTTHQLPVGGATDGCGDTTGGRDDFRDSIVFRRISTGPDGRASTTFSLPDDITSWHISATAVDGRLRAGDGATLLPVGLPFFADAILAPEFLAGETPVLRVRAAGDALEAGAQVRYTVTSASLLMAPTTAEATGSEDASVQLPALGLGSQSVVIDAVVVGHPELHDRLTRTFVVRGSRLGLRTSTTVDPAVAASVGGPGLTTYVVSDAGRGSLFPVLSDLSGSGGARFDRALAAEVARQLLVADFGIDPLSLPASSFDASRWQRDGVSLLPYASTDLELTALAAIVAPERLDRISADGAFGNWLADEGLSRERRIVALAGQAGLGDDVVTLLESVDRSALTPRESLWLGLGYLASGDETTARSIERQLLGADGEELGPWVRLRVGASLGDTVEATSLAMLLAAGVGDPLAPRMLAYVRETPSPAFLPALHEIGAIRWLLERLPRDAATFSWTVDGLHHDETLKAGEVRTIVVSQAQRAGLTIVPVKGTLSVIATWTDKPVTGSLPSSDLVSIERTMSPASAAGRTDIVHVTLTMAFKPQAPAGCYDVTEWAPSGLAPIVWTPGWDDEPVSDAGSNDALRPWAVDGQKVSWCVDLSSVRQAVLVYSARVVSPGTFTWEPAIVQAAAAPSIGASTPSTTYSIR